MSNNNNNLCAPIALFVYSRKNHTEKTVSALVKNILADQSDLFIFSDGFKNEEDETKVNEVRSYLKTITGFKSVSIIERERNLGLAKSIISGATEVVNKYGKIIVVEDDLVTSPYFLKYMNDGLSLYENEEKVASIHGYVYPVKEKLPDTFFIRGADCWGWATWKRAWDFFEPDGQKLLDQLVSRKLEKDFDFDDSYPYTEMLHRQIKGQNNSWAVRWYASAFLRDMLTLYPGQSLVQNIGFDGTGTHSKSSNKENFDILLSTEPNYLQRIKIEENLSARRAFIKYFRRNKSSFFSLIKSYVSFFLRDRLKRISWIRRMVISLRIRRNSHLNTPLGKKIPWIEPEATKWLGKYLTKEMLVFEWGSGGSTLFSAERAKKVISVEHNYEWFLKTKNELRKNHLANVEYKHIEADQGIIDEYSSTDRNYLTKNFRSYCQAINKYPNNYFDLIFIDGRARVACIRQAIPKVKSGGYILLDNSEREEYSEGLRLLESFVREDFQNNASTTSIFQKQTLS